MHTCGWLLQVCDEGQRLKEAKGNKTSEALRCLVGAKRIVLTGTPMQVAELQRSQEMSSSYHAFVKCL